MINRNIEPLVRKTAEYYPVVTVTGPRQSGKTTLCRALFPHLKYVSFELIDVREYALRDPRGFLAEHSEGAVFDEIQHAPELLSYLQVEVDARPEPGRFILTGSQHFGLAAAISQTPAGRTAVLCLLPLSLDELARFPSARTELFEVMWAGGYPRIHDVGIPADRWLSDYVATYVERDVRQLTNVGDLRTFSAFLKLAAGRSAQTENSSGLGADAGVSHNTARAWLSILEASYLVMRLPSWQRNLTKRLTRAPKGHFLDSGLLCHLLGIRSPEELRHHPLRGAVFESFVASEIAKHRANSGRERDLFHYRDARGLEVDLVLDRGSSPLLIEVKSGATVSDDFLDPLDRLARHVAQKTGDAPRRALVYGGVERQSRTGCEIVPWNELPALLKSE
jgi:hypothetical protein